MAAEQDKAAQFDTHSAFSGSSAVCSGAHSKTFPHSLAWDVDVERGSRAQPHHNDYEKEARQERAYAELRSGAGVKRRASSRYNSYTNDSDGWSFSMPCKLSLSLLPSFGHLDTPFLFLIYLVVMRSLDFYDS